MPVLIENMHVLVTVGSLIGAYAGFFTRAMSAFIMVTGVKRRKYSLPACTWRHIGVSWNLGVFPLLRRVLLAVIVKQSTLVM